MMQHTERNHAQSPAAPVSPLNNPPVVVVDCEINIAAGCFKLDSTTTTTTHHQASAAHKMAMAEWAISLGMFSRDAHDLAEREPLKFDEAVHEILSMAPERLAGLNNLGGWIVWFIAKRAVGRRRVVGVKPDASPRGYLQR
jgi:hypothetical protein